MSLVIPNDVIEYMDKYWKPNQDDSYIVVEKETEIYEVLLDWFVNHKTESIDVGPFVGIVPYGVFEVEENLNRAEFVFVYDRIDPTKLEAKHLTLT